MEACSVCRKQCAHGEQLRHLVCKHVSHFSCMSEEPLEQDYDLCKTCQDIGEVAETTPATIFVSTTSQEPRIEDGRNRLNGERALVGNGLFSRFKKSREETLLCNQVPMNDIFTKHKVGLDHFLDAGITADHFLKNHYGWKDGIGLFRAIRDDKTRHKAFAQLGLNATHFRDYPELLNLNEVVKDLGIKDKVKFVRDTLGLQFPELSCLECHGDTNWTAHNCVTLGLNMDELIALGLESTNQLDDLRRGMTPSVKREAWTKLGITEEHIKGLKELSTVYSTTRMHAPSSAPKDKNYTSEEEEEEEVKRPPRVGKKGKQQVTYESEEEEEEEEDLPPPPPPVPAAKQKKKKNLPVRQRVTKIESSSSDGEEQEEQIRKSLQKSKPVRVPVSYEEQVSMEKKKLAPPPASSILSPTDIDTEDDATKAMIAKTKERIRIRQSLMQ